MADRESVFWSHVERGDSEACWEWRGRLTPNGYGTFWDGERHVRAHRWSYELEVAPIPDGLVIDHLCRNRACVNPNHLEPVTHAENVRRGEAGWHMREKAAALTHCKNGHEWTPENTNVRTLKDGRQERRCRACQAAQNKRRRQGPKPVCPICHQEQGVDHLPRHMRRVHNATKEAA